MIYYLIYNERFSESIIQTQVINLLSDYNRTFPDFPIQLIAFQNIFFWLSERNYRKQLVEDAQKVGLEIQVYPFALPTRGWLVGPLGIQLHRLIFKITSQFIPEGTVICRGYLGTYLASEVIAQRHFNVIADPRSLYVRENIGTRWNEGDAKHQLWLDIEKSIIRRSKGIIVVNRTMSDYFCQIQGVRHDSISIVPIYSRAASMGKASSKSGERVRLIYVGSLSFSKWNDINAYRKFFSALNHEANRIELVLAVKHDGPLIDELRRHLAQMQYPYSLHIALKPAQVFAELAKADVGLTITDPWEDAGTRTGIKTVEYLANNLIVWTTKYFYDVAKTVRDTDTGFVFDSSNPTPDQITYALDDFLQRRQQLLSQVNALYQANYSSRFILNKLRSALQCYALSNNRSPSI